MPTWKKAKRSQKIRSVTQYLDNETNIYEKDEIVTGYKYGETFVPIESMYNKLFSSREMFCAYITKTILIE